MVEQYPSKSPNTNSKETIVASDAKKEETEFDTNPPENHITYDASEWVSYSYTTASIECLLAPIQACLACMNCWKF